MWDKEKQNNFVQEYSLIIVEKDAIDRDCKGVEKNKNHKKGGRANCQ
jgi:hypothetical protein